MGKVNSSGSPNMHDKIDTPMPNSWFLNINAGARAFLYLARSSTQMLCWRWDCRCLSLGENESPNHMEGIKVYLDSSSYFPIILLRIGSIRSYHAMTLLVYLP